MIWVRETIVKPADCPKCGDYFPALRRLDIAELAPKDLATAGGDPYGTLALFTLYRPWKHYPAGQRLLAHWPVRLGSTVLVEAT